MSSFIKKAALPAKDYANIIKAVGNAQVIMIGEASHGTHEFYKERAEITKRLICEKEITFVAVEGDWPDVYKINRFVRGILPKEKLEWAFGDFKRFPRWMWRNEEVLEFVKWLRDYNDSLSDDKKIGFYGMDLYSLFESAHEVLQYLEKSDPEAAERARKRYACFDRFHGDTTTYGYATAFGMKKTCEDEVKKVLLELLHKHRQQFSKYGGDDESWYAALNAQVVKDAEEYYRGMFTENTWNLRDKHMVNTVKEIIKYLSKRTTHPQKGVLWAHNSHLGDAGATESRRRRETNIGELVRKDWGLENTFNIGFSTFNGTVAAADNWDEPVKFKRVRDGLPGSFENLFHEANIGDFALFFRSNDPQALSPDDETVEALKKNKLERAIGVIYRPDTERQSHYFEASISKQFDCVIHIDQTSHVRPLDKDKKEASYIEAEEPETYPTGL